MSYRGHAKFKKDGAFALPLSRPTLLNRCVLDVLYAVVVLDERGSK